MNRASQRKIPCYRDRLAAFAYSGLTEGGVDVTSGRIQIRKFLGWRNFVDMFRYFGAKLTTVLIYDDPTYLRRDRHLRSSRRYICLVLAPTIEPDFLVLSEATLVPILTTLGRRLQAYFASSGEAIKGNGYGLKVMRRVGGTEVQRKHARQQLEDFTLATLNGLIERDEQRYARQSDLAYLARLDVTFIQRDGVWSFCINEVERPLMDLFLRTDVQGAALLYRMASSNS
ncbi:hypothetical protein B0H14DRAFT_3865010 [Mycena olivaceomarginata]|nr:hypothetical protein B0H14DRAFT_3865010 [Mycena olivaceomarginata]